MIKNFYGFVLARLGSKGVKKKNLKKIKDKNLVELTLHKSQKSGLLNDIFLCSDSDIILKCSKKYNCKTIKRPKNLSKDQTHIFEILDFLFREKKIIKNEKGIKKYIVLLSPTSPFRSTKLINFAIKKMIKNNSKSLISVVENSNCIFKSIFIKKEKLKPVFKLDNINMNRQEFKKTYMPNGSIFIFDLNFFLRNKKIISPDCLFVVHSKKDSIDIDSYDDLNYARYLAKK